MVDSLFVSWFSVGKSLFLVYRIEVSIDLTNDSLRRAAKSPQNLEKKIGGMKAKDPVKLQKKYKRLVEGSVPNCPGALGGTAGIMPRGRDGHDGTASRSPV